MKFQKNQHNILCILTAVYAFFLFILLFYRASERNGLPYLVQLREHINLVPFSTICRYVRYISGNYRPALVKHASINIYGNIFLFIPFGLLPPLTWPVFDRYWKILILTIVVISAVEVLQLLLLVGWCDIDDLILNVLGSSVGYALFRVTHRRKKICDA